MEIYIICVDGYLFVFADILIFDINRVTKIKEFIVFYHG